MILGEAYQRCRKIEPLSIHIMRIITMLILLICILIFIINLTLNIINDKPVVSNSYIQEDMPVPDIKFFSESLFVVASCNFKNSVSGLDYDCNSYTSESLIKNGPYYYVNFSIPFAYGYKMVLDTSNDTRYAQYGKRGEKIISFQINFFDQNANPSLFVEISDSEPVYLKENISSTFLQSITMTNTLQILPKEDTNVNLGRNIRQIIIPNWKATMGFQPDYEIIPYLTSRIITSRERFMQNNEDLSNLAFFNIKADFDITIIETEQRTHTILSSLGLLGGAWSFAIIAYKLLFGMFCYKPIYYIVDGQTRH
ncbi:hypothetical protein C2G38_1394883 [Gigaspora rosea]|uniref:Uncharacterized protein n=1 Tax=Gigaspora rosea TaxID=44941 RepID=A0A397V855_9GLOM|nr:hypothetical protein C2G38_1394883 [Gigaspora rosea]